LVVVQGVVGSAALASVRAVLGEGSDARHGVWACVRFRRKDKLTYLLVRIVKLMNVLVLKNSTKHGVLRGSLYQLLLHKLDRRRGLE
jgi:hypothetical protein